MCPKSYSQDRPSVSALRHHGQYAGYSSTRLGSRLQLCWARFIAPLNANGERQHAVQQAWSGNKAHSCSTRPCICVATFSNSGWGMACGQEEAQNAQHARRCTHACV